MRTSEVLRHLRQQQADARRAPAAAPSLRGLPALDRRHAAALPGRGRHAARPRPQPGLASSASPSCYLKIEGTQPDRLVQGPRHGRGRGQGARGGRAGRSSAPRPATPRPRPPPMARRAGLEVIVVLPAGRDRGRQARPGADGRRAGRRRRRQLRRCAAHRARDGRARRRAWSPADPRQLGQPAPHRGAEDGRLRDLRRPRRRA